MKMPPYPATARWTYGARNLKIYTIPGNSQMDIRCSEFENLQYSIKNKIKLEIGNSTQINISFNSSGSNLSSCLMAYRDRYYL